MKLGLFNNRYLVARGYMIATRYAITGEQARRGKTRSGSAGETNPAEWLHAAKSWLLSPDSPRAKAHGPLGSCWCRPR